MMDDFFAGLHPIVQLFYFSVVILISIFLPHPAVIACSFLGAAGYCIWLDGWKKVLRFQGLCMFPMVIVLIAVNACFSHYGVTPLYYLKTGAVTLESIVFGSVLAWMLWTSVVWFSAVNRVMTMDRWVYLLGRCTPALSLALAITLRFIPRCRKQFQKMREMRMYENHTRHKIRHGAGQLSMLITWALESGVEMADSMRARGYGAGRRTSYGIYRMEQGDRVIFCMLLVLAAACIGGFAGGYAGAEYNPAIRIAAAGGSAGSILVYACWALFCFFPLEAGSIQKMRSRW